MIQYYSDLKLLTSGERGLNTWHGSSLSLMNCFTIVFNCLQLVLHRTKLRLYAIKQKKSIALSGI